MPCRKIWLTSFAYSDIRAYISLCPEGHENAPSTDSAEQEALKTDRRAAEKRFSCMQRCYVCAFLYFPVENLKTRPEETHARGKGPPMYELYYPGSDD